MASPTYFAELDKSGVVLRVIVADAEFVATQPGTWVETCMDGGVCKNYAGPGYVLDSRLGAFVAPRPSADYDLDDASATWKPNAAEQARIDAFKASR